MTRLQTNALSNPLARASFDAQLFRVVDGFWSLILTVNK